ncbi:MAG: hypothetical protein HFH82_00185 [Lachnospiraceae bacterium]|nr:hypothetical protein [Lachnospiraceae bacterium]
MKFKLTKESLFYLAWILMEIHICVANSNAANFSISAVSYLCMALFTAKILWTLHYSFQELCIMAIMLLGAFVSAYRAGDMRVLWFVLVIAASKGTDFDKCVRISFRTMLGCCMVFVLFYIIGLTESPHIVTERGMRFGLGLGHPNMCAAYYSLLMVHIIYLCFQRLKISHFVLFALGAGVVYGITKSNTGVAVTLVTIIVSVVIKFLPAKKFNIKVIVLGMLAGIAVFTILPIIYNEKLSVLDNWMTGRIHQANFYYAKYGISLFGNNVNYDLTKWNRDNILDMGFAKILIHNGLFYYVLVVGGYFICLRKAVKHMRRDLMALFVSMLVYMFTENVATFIFMNVSMLAFADTLFQKNLYDMEKEREYIIGDEGAK